MSYDMGRKVCAHGQLHPCVYCLTAERDQLRARVAEHDRALERACRLVMDRAWATGHASDAAELMAEVLRQADEVTAKAQARVAELERACLEASAFLRNDLYVNRVTNALAILDDAQLSK